MNSILFHLLSHLFQCVLRVFLPEPAGSREFPDAIPLRLHGVPTGLGSNTNVCNEL
ncbi:MAG TPA: hypothetical protein VL485_17875 [Ktedonobacteraceae bacterium]|nr:hypothetical protein [Ktedonobacteraceae bacterium]